MKLLTTLLCILITYTSSTAQSYIPIPLDSSVFWSVEVYTNPALNPPLYCEQKIQSIYYTGDTIINHRTYAQLTTTNCGYQECGVYPLHFPYIRQDHTSKSVYALSVTDSINEVVLMDFSLGKGDSFYDFTQETMLFVDSMALIMLSDGLYHKALFFNGGNYWIEGIGSSNGTGMHCNSFEGICATTRCFYATSFNYTPAGQGLNCTNCKYLQSSTPQIPNPGISVYPNPGKNNFYIKANQDINAYVVDLYGKPIRQYQLPANTNTTLSLEGVSNGNYIIIIRDKKGEILLRNKITKIN